MRADAPGETERRRTAPPPDTWLDHLRHFFERAIQSDEPLAAEAASEGPSAQRTDRATVGDEASREERLDGALRRLAGRVADLEARAELPTAWERPRSAARMAPARDAPLRTDRPCPFCAERELRAASRLAPRVPTLAVIELGQTVAVSGPPSGGGAGENNRGLRRLTIRDYLESAARLRDVG